MNSITWKCNIMILEYSKNTNFLNVKYKLQYSTHGDSLFISEFERRTKNDNDSADIQELRKSCQSLTSLGKEKGVKTDAESKSGFGSGELNKFFLRKWPSNIGMNIPRISLIDCHRRLKTKIKLTRPVLVALLVFKPVQPLLVVLSVVKLVPFPLIALTILRKDPPDDIQSAIITTLNEAVLAEFCNDYQEDCNKRAQEGIENQTFWIQQAKGKMKKSEMEVDADITLVTPQDLVLDEDEDASDVVLDTANSQTKLVRWSLNKRLMDVKERLSFRKTALFNRGQQTKVGWCVHPSEPNAANNKVKIPGPCFKCLEKVEDMEVGNKLVDSRKLTFSGTINDIVTMTETVALSLDRFKYHIKLYNRYTVLDVPSTSNRFFNTEPLEDYKYLSFLTMLKILFKLPKKEKRPFHPQKYMLYESTSKIVHKGLGSRQLSINQFRLCPLIYCLILHYL
ncbi:hypothetical protein K501DRAFT_275449 [Backusella circina FSU 941]|nr:hypothetical protein K501DRAFT_275449 [Backusella circina FSU 941]